MLKSASIFALTLILSSEAEASARSYSRPTLDGSAISACLGNGTSCGKPAADAFCQMQGYRESILFAREPVVQSLAIDSRAICTTGACEAFARIKCYIPASAEQAALY